ncbi:MAG: inner rane protein ybcI [Rhodocyclales bacterium]|nr:inner rane protein ybcI [Rhodocyclales bacterium]
MPTILTHPAVPLAIGLGLGSGVVPPRLLLAGVLACILPDADVISFHFGIPYASAMGHRGLSHSIAFALIVALAGAFASRSLRAKTLTTFVFLFIAAVSHGVLDSFTNGGQGIAFLWPFSTERFFSPFQVIEVSPIGAARLFSSRGAHVLLSELLWVWTPCVILAAAMWAVRSRGETGKPALSASQHP